jgi:hypothetical protein
MTAIEINPTAAAPAPESARPLCGPLKKGEIKTWNSHQDFR